MRKNKEPINWSEIGYNLLLSLLSGVIIGFSFPPFQFGIIACIGFIPLFILFENLQNYGRIFKYTYFSMLIFNMISNYWVGGWSGEVDIFLIISGVVLMLIHPFFFTIPFLALHFIRKNIGERVASYSFPFLWIAFEYLHSLGELSYPWLILGNTQTYDIYKIQYIIFTGVYGISFWIVSINVMLYILYSKVIRNVWELSSWQVVSTIAFIAFIFFLPNLSSYYILKNESHSSDKMRVSIMQPNVDPWDKWKKAAQFDLVKNLIDMTYNANRTFKPDLVIWPETGIPYYIRQPVYVDDYLAVKKFVDSLNIDLVSGFADVKFYKEGDIIPPSSKKSKLTGSNFDSFNSILLMQKHSDQLQVYHKIKLVPFSERIPYLDLYPSLINVLEWGVGISNWAIGRDSTIFNIDSDTSAMYFRDGRVQFSDKTENYRAKFWAMVCYESIYPGFVSDFVRRGAQFLVIITNDSWFGNSSGPYQHNQFAVLRAIENRRSIARCANGGISSLIDPFGRIINKTKLFSQGVLNGELEIRNDQTFYSQFGDVFAISLTYLSGLLLILSIINKFRSIIKIHRK